MPEFLHHFLFPKESNNFRPKLLHHSSLLVAILFFVSVSFFSNFVQKTHPDVLGISANISTEELLALTNQKRMEAGLAPLKLDNQLSAAAAQKASDMFNKNYWAHNAPDGVTPWVFFKSAGYEYTYAGENLARGFDTSSAVVDAWIASPGHRDNLMSSNYTDIGFAIVPGTLTGDETVLVVQMFGSRTQQQTPLATADITDVSTVSPTPVIVRTSPFPSVTVKVTPQQNPTPIVSVRQETRVAAVTTKPLVNEPFLSKSMGITVAGLFLAVLSVDMIVIERKKILRAVGHNLDHILFLGIILLSLLVITNRFVL